MRLIATLLSLTAAGFFLGGCATGSTDYQAPDNLRTQQEMQEAQSRVLRSNIR